MSSSILLIEDNQDIAALIKANLAQFGYKVEHESDGASGLLAAQHGNHSLVILDVMLPIVDGLEVCRQIRAKREDLPILFLSARDSLTDRVLGLELGGDDYLAKPFDVSELIARVRAITRRNSRLQSEHRIMQFGELSVDPLKRRATKGTETVNLTAREFDLLMYLASYPGRPFSRGQLLNSVWGYTFDGYEHTVNSHINRLRGKIETDVNNPRFILTVRGVGYRFCETTELQVSV